MSGGDSMFQWTSDLALGNDAIDAEHRSLFQLAECLHRAMLAGSGKAVLDECLKDLSDYADKHFLHEEQYMKEIHFPERKAHAAQHRDFRRKVAQFRQRYQTGEGTMTIELLQFVSHWLKRHTSTCDV